MHCYSKQCFTSQFFNLIVFSYFLFVVKFHTAQRVQINFLHIIEVRAIDYSIADEESASQLSDDVFMTQGLRVVPI